MRWPARRRDSYRPSVISVSAGSNMREFRDRVAVVTGAASGIGRGLAEKFAAEGMRVVLADVEQGALDQAEREMREGGATVLGVRTDVSNAADVQALADRTIQQSGSVQILCNNA